MTDLHTLAAEISALLVANRVPLMVRAGKRALRWSKVYSGAAGYGISKGVAANILRGYGLTHLAA